MNVSGRGRESATGYPGRKMTTTDAMILVACLAAGLAAWRGVLATPIMQDRSFRGSVQWFYFQALGLTALLVPLSLSLLAMALRQPRPRFRRMLDPPAVIVGLTTLVVVTTDTTTLLTVRALVGPLTFDFPGSRVFYHGRMLAEQTGMCLLAAWCPRALAGRCRGPRGCGWLDRLGWALGAWWVLFAIGSAFFTLT
jgi:hypothetical protein